MSLATVIRLEFAYPGIGVLAGDSLQYLSIATAHGVIMVFFMIMPLIFGAFGNFLLPTQLGVHDVAFPRLNSAAFWFLPGGLIMLCQLVCIDRRYQRMNCFNIRELQGILKRRFFTDLVNSSDFRNLLDESMVGLRFKTGNQNSIQPNSALFYNYGLTTDQNSRSALFSGTQNTSNVSNLQTNSLNFKLTYFFTGSTYSQISGGSMSFYNNITTLVREFISALTFTLYFSSLNSLKYLIDSLITVTSTNFNLNLITKVGSLSLNPQNLNLTDPTTNNLTSGLVTDGSQVDNSSYYTESSDFRFTRFNNALIQYDYKCGNYIGTWDKLYPSLINSYIEVARGVRKPS